MLLTCCCRCGAPRKCRCNSSRRGGATRALVALFLNAEGVGILQQIHISRSLCSRQWIGSWIGCPLKCPQPLYAICIGFEMQISLYFGEFSSRKSANFNKMLCMANSHLTTEPYKMVGKTFRQNNSFKITWQKGLPCSCHLHFTTS